MILLQLILFLQCLYGLAQQPDPAKIKKENIKITDLNDYTVTTCFQSEHLESLMKKTWKKNSISDSGFFFRETRLADDDFVSLTASEKFIYAHQYPESYMQSCGLYDLAKDMSKFYANIPYLFDGTRKSERQRKSLHNNRDTTIASLKKCINFHTYIPLAYKQTILDVNTWEFIPDILRLEGRMNKNNNETPKDPYIYSLLMVLMKNNDFVEFKKISIYKSLYGPDSGYRANVNFTEAVRNQLIDMSGKFYLWKLSETK